MRNGIIMVIVLMTLLLSSASALAHTHTTTAESSLCSLIVQEPMLCSFDDVSADGASEHQRPAPHPAQLPERAMRTHPSYFLHPEQQPLYLLAYTLAQHTAPFKQRFKAPPASHFEPWYIAREQKKCGLINHCQAANLTYRSRLHYES